MKKDDEADDDDEAWLMVAMAMVAEINNENNMTTKMAAMASPDDRGWSKRFGIDGRRRRRLRRCRRWSAVFVLCAWGVSCCVAELSLSSGLVLKFWRRHSDGKNGGRGFSNLKLNF